MESRVEAAADRHSRGYNCAQAVACTYADLVGVTEEDMFRLTSGLGLGMGSMEGTCGALSGACLLTSALTHGEGGKAAAYAASRKLVERFRSEAGATRCRDIKGIDTGTVLCPCQGCVIRAAGIVEDVLLADKNV